MPAEPLVTKYYSKKKEEDLRMEFLLSVFIGQYHFPQPPPFSGRTRAFETLIKHMPLISGILSFLQGKRKQRKQLLVGYNIECVHAKNSITEFFLATFFQLRCSLIMHFSVTPISNIRWKINFIFYSRAGGNIPIYVGTCWYRSRCC